MIPSPDKCAASRAHSRAPTRICTVSRWKPTFPPTRSPGPPLAETVPGTAAIAIPIAAAASPALPAAAPARPILPAGAEVFEEEAADEHGAEAEEDC
ncbi:hypothetical protein DL768_002125 [Monosporascus sp. mg162]|nr:hypothetical protein DL768_002125 [Monosporascus sp. mg162]